MLAVLAVLVSFFYNVYELGNLLGEANLYFRYRMSAPYKCIAGAYNAPYARHLFFPPASSVSSSLLDSGPVTTRLTMNAGWDDNTGLALDTYLTVMHRLLVILPSRTTKNSLKSSGPYCPATYPSVCATRYQTAIRCLDYRADGVIRRDVL